jgi:6-phosphofructokinase 1
MTRTIHRISVNTGGGDAPGLNAVIQSVVYAAGNLGWEVLGIREGYDGLLFPERYPEGGLVQLDKAKVEGIAKVGGTILGTTSRGNPFKVLQEDPDNIVREVDLSHRVLEAFGKHGIDAHIAVGGDGSLTIALQLHRKGLRLVGVPKTIDNDLQATVMTFGFSSAVSFATDCIERLHLTAKAHRRIMVVEVMGRYAGWIALHCGIAGEADAILIPEIPYDIRKVADHLKAKICHFQEYGIVVVAEGARPVGGGLTVKAREPGRQERLGGVGDVVARELQELTGYETRSVVLGHLLRGGSPNAQDKILGLSFGAAAVHALKEGHDGIMVALNPPCINYVPLEEAVRTIKTVPRDGDLVIAARALNIGFGD